MKYNLAALAGGLMIGVLLYVLADFCAAYGQAKPPICIIHTGGPWYVYKKSMLGERNPYGSYEYRIGEGTQEPFTLYTDENFSVGDALYLEKMPPQP